MKAVSCNHRKGDTENLVLRSPRRPCMVWPIGLAAVCWSGHPVLGCPSLPHPLEHLTVGVLTVTPIFQIQPQRGRRAAASQPPLCSHLHHTGRGLCVSRLFTVAGDHRRCICSCAHHPFRFGAGSGAGRTAGGHRKAPWRWGIEARTEVSVLPKLLGMGVGEISGPPPRDTWESVLCFTLFVGEFPFLCAISEPPCTVPRL